MSSPEESLDERLVRLYGEIAAMTRPICAGTVEHGCKVPFSCCSSEYCEHARDYAKTEWGVELRDTGHDRLPFMGAGIGARLSDSQWTRRYFTLRNKIDALEMQRLSERRGSCRRG